MLKIQSVQQQKNYLQSLWHYHLAAMDIADDPKIARAHSEIVNLTQKLTNEFDALLQALDPPGIEQ